MQRGCRSCLLSPTPSSGESFTLLALPLCAAALGSEDSVSEAYRGLAMQGWLCWGPDSLARVHRGHGASCSARPRPEQTREDRHATGSHFLCLLEGCQEFLLGSPSSDGPGDFPPAPGRSCSPTRTLNHRAPPAATVVFSGYLSSNVSEPTPSACFFTGQSCQPM